ncbi:MAG: hypothetical protein IAE86_00730 [Burkholderiaceae bacterium]|nr:hypothetical protein [Burkholderiaceae bacterium]
MAERVVLDTSAPLQRVDDTGLDLAIVKTVAARHGARVTLGDSPLGGLRVEVRFAPSR